MSAHPDWSKLLLDLRMAGLSTRRVASLLIIPRGTIQALMYGHEPRYSTGKALIELHTDTCKLAEIST